MPEDCLKVSAASVEGGESFDAGGQKLLHEVGVMLLQQGQVASPLILLSTWIWLSWTNFQVCFTQASVRMGSSWGKSSSKRRPGRPINQRLTPVRDSTAVVRAAACAEEVAGT